ncbi:hypothetical protein [Arthrobacter sp. CAU 1506]|uniref:hypothetical protein n=1 Tax=Arthrobacter sp. CAU 1506 TaxID=2560052 RepID=UPI00145C4FEB|nr:hypothetical protein [Arthrobacter sp. CAU 1506]
MPAGDGDAPISYEVISLMRKFLQELEDRMPLEDLLNASEKFTQIERELRRVQAK